MNNPNDQDNYDDENLFTGLPGGDNDDLFGIGSNEQNFMETQMNNEKHLQFRLQQLGKKRITLIIGIDQLDCDLSKLKSKISTKFACSCSLKKFKEGKHIGECYFKLSGDHRYELKEYLLENGYVDKYDKLTIHG